MVLVKLPNFVLIISFYKCHFISAGEMFFKDFYLKMARSKNVAKKKYQILPTEIVFSPDEVFDTYMEFSEDLYLDINIHNSLLQKASSHI